MTAYTNGKTRWEVRARPSMYGDYGIMRIPHGRKAGYFNMNPKLCSIFIDKVQSALDALAKKNGWKKAEE